MFKKWLFAHLLLFAVAFVTADSLFGVTAPRGETFTVPDLCGMSEADVLADARLDVTSEYRYDDRPAGTVLSQDPPAETARKLGEKNDRCAVRVVVSMGPETAPVPDVVGQPARVAAARLREAGFLVEEVAVAGGAAGNVVSTAPAAGERLHVGETVRVAVAEGDAEAFGTVPDVVGLSRDEAVLALFLKGYAVGNVTETESAQPAGTVVRQSPVAGSPLPPKTEVSLVVSAAPQ